MADIMISIIVSLSLNIIILWQKQTLLFQRLKELLLNLLKHRLLLLLLMGVNQLKTLLVPLWLLVMLQGTRIVLLNLVELKKKIIIPELVLLLVMKLLVFFQMLLVIIFLLKLLPYSAPNLPCQLVLKIMKTLVGLLAL